MLVSIDELRSTLQTYLASLGLDARDRTTLSNLIVEQEMVGNRFSAVRNAVKKGDHISPSDIREEVVVRKPAMTLVRGHGRMAPLITADYLDSAIATARSQGIYALGIYDSTYNDFFEVFCRRIAHEGCIGLIFENGWPQGVVPHGGKRDVMGTNPLAYGIPTHDDPIVFDAATATHAWRLIGQARERGELLPAGYLDRDGRETRDPAEAVAILPFGWAKGYAINLLVDVLSGALVRGRCGLDQPLDSQRYIGTLMMIIDPEAFGDIMEFKDSTTKLVRDLMAVPPVNPDEPVHVPGMRGAAAYRECVRTGMVDVDTEAWQILLAATRG